MYDNRRAWVSRARGVIYPRPPFVSVMSTKTNFARIKTATARKNEFVRAKTVLEIAVVITTPRINILLNHKSLKYSRSGSDLWEGVGERGDISTGV